MGTTQLATTVSIFGIFWILQLAQGAFAWWAFLHRVSTSSSLSPWIKTKKRYSSTCRWSIGSHATFADEEEGQLLEGHVVVLNEGKYWMVVEKSPGVVCHHSEWTGSRSNREVPMLQRVREAMGGRRVNLIHRLDRGCSGCLLLSFAAHNNSEDHGSDATAALSESMRIKTGCGSANKTYVALVRGEGILHGRNFSDEGWFLVDRPIRDERGTLHDATTWFRFLAGQDNVGVDRPRVSLVLARPETGRWHQIRRHLNGLSHPILGDSTHGNSKVNREFRSRYNMPYERTCLHLAQLQLPPVQPFFPDGIHVSCPLYQDMWNMLQTHMPDVWLRSVRELENEGIYLTPGDTRAISQQRRILPFSVRVPQ